MHSANHPEKLKSGANSYKAFFVVIIWIRSILCTYFLNSSFYVLNDNSDIIELDLGFCLLYFVSENSGQTQSRDNPSVKAEVEQHSALLFASVI